MFAARSNIHGGAGGDTSCMDSGCPSSGGIAIYMNDALDGPASNPVGWLLDVMVGGGAPGNFVPGPRNRDCDPPEFGQTFAGDLTPFSFTAASLGFSIPSIAREGDLVTVTFTGPPGARVYLNDRTTTTFQAVASWRGVLLAPFASAGAPEREIKWGVIPSSGELKRTYPVPQLAPGEEAQTRFLQAYRVGPNGITLGTFRTLTVLDSSL
jgi:hypothetical protein